MSHIQPLTRPHFQRRQMVTAVDLQAGVEYLAERLRRHNRFLHGCGVTCGLEVQVDPIFEFEQVRELRVRAAPGQAISPQGDLIQVPADFDGTFSNALISSKSETASANIGIQIATSRAAGLEQLNLYVILRHATSGDRPRATLPGACLDDNPPQHHTRLNEGYRIELALFQPMPCATPAQSTCGDVLDELLRYDSMQTGAQLADFVHCPPNSAESWLVLATVNISFDEAGSPQFQTHYRDRSLLPSTRLLLELLRCFPDAPRIDEAVILRVPNSRWHWVGVTGKGFEPFDHVVIHDPRMPAFLESVRDTSLSFYFYVPPELPEGRRAFSVVTEFDSIESAKCGVFLDVQQPYFPPYYYPYGYGYAGGSGTIGGGNL
jgi:hypothetical protein